MAWKTKWTTIKAYFNVWQKEIKHSFNCWALFGSIANIIENFLDDDTLEVKAALALPTEIRKERTSDHIIWLCAFFRQCPLVIRVCGILPDVRLIAISIFCHEIWSVDASAYENISSWMWTFSILQRKLKVNTEREFCVFVGFVHGTTNFLHTDKIVGRSITPPINELTSIHTQSTFYYNIGQQCSTPSNRVSHKSYTNTPDKRKQMILEINQIMGTFNGSASRIPGLIFQQRSQQ